MYRVAIEYLTCGSFLPPPHVVCMNEQWAGLSSSDIGEVSGEVCTTELQIFILVVQD